MSDIETALLTIKQPITPVKHPMHQQESIIPSHILLMNTSNPDFLSSHVVCAGM